jgi:hypothetical protein
MATKTRPMTRLEIARGRLDEAQAHDAALRAQQLEDGSVAAAEFGASAHALEACRVDLEGAEQAEQAEAAQRRTARLAKVRAALDEHSDAAGFLADFKAYAEAGARLARRLGPERDRLISEAYALLQREGVPPMVPGTAPRDLEDTKAARRELDRLLSQFADPDVADEDKPTAAEIDAARAAFDGTAAGGAHCRAEDAGLSWSPIGIGGVPVVLTDDGRRFSPLFEAGLTEVFKAGNARAARKAGLIPGAVSAGGAMRGLSEDPEAWAARNL